MRIQPREELLGIWRSIIDYSVPKNDPQGEWLWNGRSARNSISDAELLLSILYPASFTRVFRLSRPDQTQRDIRQALGGLGDEFEIPRRLVEILIRHIEDYTEDDGPVFSGGSYFLSAVEGEEPTGAQAQMDMVDSCSMAVTLMLSTIAFVRDYQSAVRSSDTRDRLRHLEEIASRRLTAAMVGLLRGFVINIFSPEAPEGQALIRTLNQHNDSPRRITEDFFHRLADIRASVREVSIGFGSSIDELENRNRLFEVGWTWGIAQDAPEVEGVASLATQRKGVARGAPILYFTLNALDGIADLFSPRTARLSLLSEEQQRLAASLRLRWEITQRYWSSIATYGEGRWPLEDVPWRTNDRRASEHFSLLVSSIVISDLENRPAINPPTLSDLGRMHRVLQELGQRGRIIRRAETDDQGVELHRPGTLIPLPGSEGLDGGPLLAWELSDYSAVLYKCVLRLASLTQNQELRDTVVAFSDDIWEHLHQRRMTSKSGGGLWDDPSNAFPGITERFEEPSWYYTERIVECLVAVINHIETDVAPSQDLLRRARELLSEAERRYDREVLGTPAGVTGDLRTELERVGTRLQRCREIIDERPGTSMGISLNALESLDRLEVARRKADREAG
ncbi:SCO2524 family protein [Actinocorallia populi]|uniref:SCO2524 family protein n=1 Tax=Actinocorallia populi TaxID=2079200 RepID=UPI000D08A32B|nr:SCO2524 family protein [Actinocorallia populi]